MMQFFVAEAATYGTQATTAPVKLLHWSKIWSKQFPPKRPADEHHSPNSQTLEYRMHIQHSRSTFHEPESEPALG